MTRRRARRALVQMHTRDITIVTKPGDLRAKRHIQLRRRQLALQCASAARRRWIRVGRRECRRRTGAWQRVFDGKGRREEDFVAGGGTTNCETARIECCEACLEKTPATVRVRFTRLTPTAL